MASGSDWVVSSYKVLVPIEIVFGLLANLFVLTAVGCDRKMRGSPMNLLIANLALADFLLQLYAALFYFYPIVMHTASNGLVVSAEWVCFVSGFFPDTCWAATITTFVAIAVERYIVTVHPLRAHYVNRRHIVVIIAAIWLFSAVLQSFDLFTYRAIVHVSDVSPHPRAVCRRTKFPPGMDIIRWLLIFQRMPIPVAIAAVLYTRTCMVLWRTNTIAYATSNAGRSAVQQRQAKELTRRKRAVKMMIVCVTLFFLCYAPKNIVDIMIAVKEFHPTNPNFVPLYLHLVIYLLALLCSSINPIVYAIYSAKFREQLRKFWQCVSSSSPRRMPATSSGRTAVTDASARFGTAAHSSAEAGIRRN